MKLNVLAPMLAFLLAVSGNAIAAIEQTGTPEQDYLGTGDTGTFSITVPADATLVVIGFSGWKSGEPGLFSSGSVNVDSTAATSAGSYCDASASFMMCGMYYLVNPSTGTINVSWDWTGTGTLDVGAWAATAFFKGVNTSDLVRDADGTQADPDPYTTPTLTAQSGDAVVAVSGMYVAGTDRTVTPTNASDVLEVSVATDNDLWIGENLSVSGNLAVTAAWDGDAQDGGIIAIVVKPAGGGGGGNPIHESLYLEIVQ